MWWREWKNSNFWVHLNQALHATATNIHFFYFTSTNIHFFDSVRQGQQRVWSRSHIFFYVGHRHFSGRYQFNNTRWSIDGREGSHRPPFYLRSRKYLVLGPLVIVAGWRRRHRATTSCYRCPMKETQGHDHLATFYFTNRSLSVREIDNYKTMFNLYMIYS
jgi:hypothetical protein